MDFGLASRDASLGFQRRGNEPRTTPVKPTALLLALPLLLVLVPAWRLV